MLNFSLSCHPSLFVCSFCSYQSQHEPPEPVTSSSVSCKIHRFSSNEFPFVFIKNGLSISSHIIINRGFFPTIIIKNFVVFGVYQFLRIVIGGCYDLYFLFDAPQFNTTTQNCNFIHTPWVSFTFMLNKHKFTHTLELISFQN